ncbi:general transcription factor II-I repeat domain-containing protein 2A-like [Acipenser oxyrinchus oxyrinchus]|uniref:General transcription factor II-I repeat domain-containing protein 2A-like n=1 Tax=Acipenser oxyrinchus oxyrinchus TaxID=40147 RepID=A0AAD8CET9_ACIOX|nr:general transcription factor II-I repeat domain-containing protein 2A-like [Acipenser oxyrinchus oxyrinchus]
MSRILQEETPPSSITERGSPFSSQLEEGEAEHAELLLHMDVRWLSRGTFLQRFRGLLTEIKEFLASRDA